MTDSPYRKSAGSDPPRFVSWWRSKDSEGMKMAAFLQAVVTTMMAAMVLSVVAISDSCATRKHRAMEASTAACAQACAESGGVSKVGWLSCACRGSDND